MLSKKNSTPIDIFYVESIFNRLVRSNQRELHAHVKSELMYSQRRMSPHVQRRLVAQEVPMQDIVKKKVLHRVEKSSSHTPGRQSTFKHIEQLVLPPKETLLQQVRKQMHLTLNSAQLKKQIREQPPPSKEQTITMRESQDTLPRSRRFRLPIKPLQFTEHLKTQSDASEKKLNIQTNLQAMRAHTEISGWETKDEYEWN